MSTETPTAPLISAAEVATKFGICRRTIFNWVARGLLNPVRFGRTLRFRSDEVDRLMAGDSVIDNATETQDYIK